jgi:urease accessory protein
MTTDLGSERSWKAELRLGFAGDGQRTVLADMDFCGPLRVQRPFYPEGGPCHCYVLHPPGGLVSGDRLRIQASVQPGAHALLTTPSAGKVYGTDSRGVAQGQDVTLSAHDGVIEWLPMETIIFDRAHALMRLDVEMNGTATVIGWDIICLGREAGNHPFATGRLDQRLHIRRNGRPLLLENLDLAGGSAMQHGAFGLGGHTVTGTMFAVSDRPDMPGLVASLRERLQPRCGRIGVTCRRGVLLVRYLGDRADEARSLFEKAWRLLRPALLGLEACAPRIWAT